MSKAKSLICRKARSEKGFSLVEFGLVMIVTGLMIAGALGVYVSYMKKAKLEVSYKRLYEANTMLSEVWSVEKRYFCPADPTLDPSDAKYGREIAGCAGIAVGTCSGGVCVSAGKDAGGGKTGVLTGMLPYKDIADKLSSQQVELTRQMERAKDPAMKEEFRKALNRAKRTTTLNAKDLAFDGWGKQLTYMVSQAWVTAVPPSTAAMQASDPNMKTGGSIIVKDDEDKEIAARGAHFAVISHGENGSGAYDAQGKLTGAVCNDLGDIERENCNKDATIKRAPVHSAGNNTRKTDDLVAFNVTVSNEMWERVPCGNDLCLRNRNSNNVSVGNTTVAAVEKLTIGGMMRAQQMDLGAKKLCNKDGTKCFNPEYIGGELLNSCDTEMGSAASGATAHVAKMLGKRAASGKDLSLTCQTITIPSYGKKCADPSKQVMLGYNNGEPVCYDPCNKDGTIDTQTRSCPPNMTGTRTCQAMYSCATRDFGPYSCTDNCTHNPVNGSCGSSHGQSMVVAPTENLCNTGVLRNPPGVADGSGAYTWHCNGQYGGTDAACSSPKPVHGQCGSANQAIVMSAPSGGSACAAGSPGSMSGSNPWTWTCSGSSGGTTASCASRAPTTVHGQCGTSHGGAYVSTPTDLCNTGAASGVTTTASTYEWTCSGGGEPSGSNASCSANRVTTVNGACGSANGVVTASAPSSNLCVSGTATAVASNATTYTWNCNGGGSPVGSNASCSAPKATTENGVCGPSNGGTYSSAPASGLCSAGVQSGVTTNAGSYTWSCNGAGVPVGSNVSCSANRVIVVNGACGGSANSCGSGTASGYSAGSCGGNQTWSCVGSGGGSTASCSIANGACAVTGQCGGSANSCNQGTASGYNAGACGGSQTWTCLGANGGGNASCSIANAACAVPVHGQCGGSANTCNQGAAVSYNAGSCGGSQTWTCQGSNGGGNASCSVANPSCGPYVFWGTNVRVQVDNGAYCSNCGTDYTMGPGFSGDHPYYSSYAWWGGDGSYGGSNNTDSICHAGLIQPGPVVAAGTVNIHGIVSKPYSFTYSPRQVPPYEHNYGNGTGGYGEHYTSTFTVPETNSVCEVKTHVWHYCGRTAGIGTRYDRFPSTDVTCRSADGSAYVARAMCQNSGINYSTAPTSANACVRGSSASAANRTGDSTTGSWTWNCTDPMGTVAACSASWEPYVPPPGGGGGCFTGTTEVIMADGSRKELANLKKGDKVRGHSQANAVVSNKPFYVRALLYRINDSKDAYVTSNHPFYTKGGGWKAIDVELARKEHPGMQIEKLEIGDILVHADGSEVELKSMESEDHGWLTVYNPSMDGDHTYYANDLLMHNLYSEYEVKN